MIFTVLIIILVALIALTYMHESLKKQLKRTKYELYDEMARQYQELEAENERLENLIYKTVYNKSELEKKQRLYRDNYKEVRRTYYGGINPND